MCGQRRGPWDLDPAMRRKLVAAGRRYAAMTDTNAGCTDEENVVRDRAEFSHFLLSPASAAIADRPRWDDVGAVAFLELMTGYDASTCRRWLIDEWDMDVPEGDTHCFHTHSIFAGKSLC